jgi:D-alanyl-lipoteichoic acid acyltransferase DltB (MBOAT superfamily)
MSFVQAEFLKFLLLVLVFYHATPSFKVQNAIILLASCVFYGWWNTSFLALILAETALAFGAGLLIERTGRKNIVLAVASTLLLLALGYFKYANFFLGSLDDLLLLLGGAPDRRMLQIVLPIGISFHTFQAIAYMVDVRRGRIAAERDMVRFAAFSMFFPQLVAGPIERASHLLAQFQQPRQIDAAKIRQAVWLIVMGYFFKVGVADVLAPMADIGFFDKGEPNSAWWVIFGILAFTLQIYCDFMGYSLIAKGVALLLGFDLSWNFLFPYWSRSIAEFWHRWHITLGLWLRDYLYIPLGGNHGSRARAAFNLCATMLLGGLWHGANWTFVIWGAWHGMALAVYHLLLKDRLPAGRLRDGLGWMATMVTVMIGWVFFRVPSLHNLISLGRAFRNWDWYPAHGATLTALIVSMAAIFVLERLQRKAPEYDSSALLPPLPRAALLGCLTIFVLAMAMHTRVSFIYFQF